MSNVTSTRKGNCLKSLVLTRDGFQIADTPMPSMMPGEVRIEVRSVGICRTDLKIWKNQIDTDLPLILGHEISGIVHDSTVPDIAPGTPVTTEIDLSCGTCWYCRNGKKHLCSAKRTLGISTDGGLTEYIVVPYDLIHQLPVGIDSIKGTFVGPLSNAIETYTRATVDPSESVLIIGTGKMGLIIAQVFEAFGSEVLLLGDNQWHMGVARQLGLQHILGLSSNWKEELTELTKVGPNIVVEATGTKRGLDIALDVVRSDGTIALTGHHEANYQINPRQLIGRELKLIGTSRGDYEMAIEMLQKGRIEVRKLVTKQFPLEQGVQAFEEASKPEVVKVNINI
ncbi:MAG: zinc-binding dehydrogenase [Candidatus Thorarchaeota archaeon]